MTLDKERAVDRDHAAHEGNSDKNDGHENELSRSSGGGRKRKGSPEVEDGEIPVDATGRNLSQDKPERALNQQTSSSGQDHLGGSSVRAGGSMTSWAPVSLGKGGYFSGAHVPPLPPSSIEQRVPPLSSTFPMGGQTIQQQIMQAAAVAMQNTRVDAGVPSAMGMQRSMIPNCLPHQIPGALPPHAVGYTGPASVVPTRLPAANDHYPPQSVMWNRQSGAIPAAPENSSPSSATEVPSTPPRPVTEPLSNDVTPAKLESDSNDAVPVATPGPEPALSEPCTPLATPTPGVTSNESFGDAPPESPTMSSTAKKKRRLGWGRGLASKSGSGSSKAETTPKPETTQVNDTLKDSDGATSSAPDITHGTVEAEVPAAKQGKQESEECGSSAQDSAAAPANESESDAMKSDDAASTSLVASEGGEHRASNQSTDETQLHTQSTSETPGDSNAEPDGETKTEDPAEGEKGLLSKEEILSKIEGLDSDIVKIESEIFRLKAQRDTMWANNSKPVPTVELLMQEELYEANRKIAQQLLSEMSLLLPPIDLTSHPTKPMYESPQDAPCYQANIRSCSKIRFKLASVIHRHDEKMARKKQSLKRKYSRLQKKWLKHLTKEKRSGIERSKKERQEEEARRAAVMIPVRSSSRIAATNRDSVRSEAELDQIIAQLEEQDKREGKHKQTFADIPSLIIDPLKKRRLEFQDTNNKLQPGGFMQLEYEKRVLQWWTDAEEKLFTEKFCKYPKDFKKIASYLDKTVGQCVKMYYKIKYKQSFKKAVREDRARKRQNKKGYVLGGSDKDGSGKDSAKVSKHLVAGGVGLSGIPRSCLPKGFREARDLLESKYPDPFSSLRTRSGDGGKTVTDSKSGTVSKSNTSSNRPGSKPPVTPNNQRNVGRPQVQPTVTPTNRAHGATQAGKSPLPRASSGGNKPHFASQQPTVPPVASASNSARSRGADVKRRDGRPALPVSSLASLPGPKSATAALAMSLSSTVHHRAHEEGQMYPSPDGMDEYMNGMANLSHHLAIMPSTASLELAGGSVDLAAHVAAQPQGRKNSSYWTQREKEDFMHNLSRYGQDWKKLAEALPHKSAAQIRNYWQSMKAKLNLPENADVADVVQHTHRLDEEASRYHQARVAAWSALGPYQSLGLPQHPYLQQQLYHLAELEKSSMLDKPRSGGLSMTDLLNSEAPVSPTSRELQHSLVGLPPDRFEPVRKEVNNRRWVEQLENRVRMKSGAEENSRSTEHGSSMPAVSAANVPSIDCNTERSIPYERDEGLERSTTSSYDESGLGTTLKRSTTSSYDESGLGTTPHQHNEELSAGNDRSPPDDEDDDRTSTDEDGHLNMDDEDDDMPSSPVAEPQRDRSDGARASEVADDDRTSHTEAPIVDASNSEMADQEDGNSSATESVDGDLRSDSCDAMQEDAPPVEGATKVDARSSNELPTATVWNNLNSGSVAAHSGPQDQEGLPLLAADLQIQNPNTIPKTEPLEAGTVSVEARVKASDANQESTSQHT